MSEIKVRVGYVAIEDYTEDYSDWTGQITFPNPRGANIYWENPIEFLEAEPVIKLLREMGEASQSLINFDKEYQESRDKGEDVISFFYQHWTEEKQKRVERLRNCVQSYNTFLASIYKGE